jgi:hypothetical protein
MDREDYFEASCAEAMSQWSGWGRTREHLGPEDGGGAENVHGDRSSGDNKGGD